MSEAARKQFLLKVDSPLLERLETQRAALGFYSSNEMSVIFLNTLSDVPPERVWECLAAIRKYHPASKKLR